MSKLAQTGHLYVRSSITVPSKATGGNLTSEGKITLQFVHLRKSWFSGLAMARSYNP